MQADLMRDGWSLADVGWRISWRDVKAYIKYARPDSALFFVNQNPPVDPATVPTRASLSSISERLAAKRTALAEASTEVVAHHKKDAPA